ncbi:uncharacterized protein A4U43_C08F4760 [Asparagus officinalis]|uniref:receptor-like serine/threonine-protein kinase ALE2 isoform X2 n=1 Tax=Asparagus officinalis TaxID=4686 RepID=UPI00098E086E|nr:receptor-like serine/threonine-protein kinase ALE2 isoform X2 [Asparagus officinalis]XP_020276867.1 receptor-like serine/threonine-protein kinase ALE2 isoform X2 [Asparagus officinalis]ONK59273.1 uncharacterized protein A4U43_C08F4760 [Asparagus officinalis]
MRGLQIISLSWVLFIAFGVLGIHGSRASISSPADYINRSGRFVALPPSELSSHVYPTDRSHLKGPISVQSPAHHSHAASTSRPLPPVERIFHSPALAPAFVLSPSYLPAPSHPLQVIQRKGRRHRASPPFIHGSSRSPINAPYPSANNERAPAPSSTSTAFHMHAPINPPVVSPSGSFSKNQPAPWPQPVKSLPPPPPNLDCSSTFCTEPLTNTPPGTPCSCVLPMKVGLRVSVALYAFFPLVSELAQEIASGVLMEQSQVRIMGANAASGEPEKTIVLINLVPRGEKFDNNTAFSAYKKFWHKQFSIKTSYFGNYDVLYVLYPGLPPSPPAAPTRAFGYGNNPVIIHPFAVDVNKPKEKHSSSLAAVIVVSCIMTLLLCVGIALALFLRNSYYKHQTKPVLLTSLPTFMKSSGAGFSRFGSRLSSGSVSMSSSIATHIGSVKTFSLSEIENATNNFNDSRIIGEGGFGLVYEGTLKDGTQVAVKVLKRDDQQGIREFMAEVEMLSRLHHRNLVKLLGICTEEYLRCLVYELIPNGSVESHLYGGDKEITPLDWNSRMKIALGAARCLAYLHEDSDPHVIHRDFKSSNILLEYDFTPKVCDFGLARAALGEQNEHISTRVMGTFGYVAPEYAMTGHLLVKSDVYSYGVVLLELLTGRKPVDMLRSPGQENLVTWARPLLTSKEGLEAIVDPSLGNNFSFDSLAKVAAIASMCVQPEVSQRPFMGEVVQALKLVCNENSGSCSQQELNVSDREIRISRDLGLEEETVISVSDMFSISERYNRDDSSSVRMYSSSGPLRTGRSRQVCQGVKGLSSGSMSEHGTGSKGLGCSQEWL